MASIALNLIPTEKFGTRGQIYEIHFNGEVIASGTSPEFNACRVLKDRGFTGKAEFYRPGKPSWDLRIGIEWGAGKTVSETDKTGVRIVKWSPHPMAEASQAA